MADGSLAADHAAKVQAMLGVLQQDANVVMGQPLVVEEKLRRMVQLGGDQLHVIADFDMTLTK